MKAFGVIVVLAALACVNAAPVSCPSCSTVPSTGECAYCLKPAPADPADDGGLSALYDVLDQSLNVFDVLLPTVSTKIYI